MLISLVPSYGGVFFPTFLFCNFRLWTLASLFVDLFWRCSLFSIHREITAAVRLILFRSQQNKRRKKEQGYTMMPRAKDNVGTGVTNMMSPLPLCLASTLIFCTVMMRFVLCHHWWRGREKGEAEREVL